MLLTVMVALFVSKAISQEIVIEPTNGRAQSASHVSRPAATASAPVKASTSPMKQESSATKKPSKKASLKQVAAKSKASAVETKSAPPEIAKSEPSAVTPVTKKIPTRPEWAMADTRDAHSLQVEIASALAHDPKLIGSSIQVNVDDGAVTLAGQATGSEEHLQAQRLAKSYAWNRKLVDHIETVRGASAQR
jgi:osmotically-inducible protein OsmY